MLHSSTSASQNDVDSIHVNIIPPLRSSRRPRPPQQQFSQFQGHSARQFVPSVYRHRDEQSSTHAPQCSQKPPTRFGGSFDVIKSHIELEINATPGWFTAGEVNPIDTMLSYFQNFSSSESFQDTQKLAFPQQDMSIVRQNGDGTDNNEALNAPGGPQSCDGTKWRNEASTEQRLVPHTYNKTLDFEQPSQAYQFRMPTGPRENKGVKYSSLSHGPQICSPVMSKEKPIEIHPPLIGIRRRSVTANPAQNDVNIPSLNIPLRISECRGGKGNSSAAAPDREDSGAQGEGGKASKLSTNEVGSLPTLLFAENEPRFSENSSLYCPHTYCTALQIHTRDTLPPELQDKTRRATMHPHGLCLYSSGGDRRRWSLSLGQTNLSSCLLAPYTKPSQGSESLVAPAPASSACVDDVLDNNYQKYAKKNSLPMSGISGVSSIINRGRPAVYCEGSSSDSERPFVAAMPHQCTCVEQSQRFSDRLRTQNQLQRLAKSAKRQASTTSLFKPLPPAPPEISLAHDPILRLNAQISNLAHRRLNAEKSIKQITKVLPQGDPMATDRIPDKRRKEKQEVDGLHDEIALIQSQEHELALKLFRAYKRQDIHTAYEPTTFWVRRIAWRV